MFLGAKCSKFKVYIMKKLLLGDEAIAQGAIDAGLSGVYAYPGTPSTEITEYIQSNPVARQRGIHSTWCTNEKTAMEAALGMSYAGRRAMVCMKHVGMNVCADAFVNAAVTGVKGGLVVVAADDPSMHSSQNEQDSRFYGKFAMVPIVEPSDQQEAYDMVQRAFDLSEQVGLPVLLRIVTRLAHSRASVEVTETPREENPLSPSSGKGWILLPGNARRQYASLIAKQKMIDELRVMIEEQPKDIPQSSFSLGIITCGIGYNYVRECVRDDMPILKVNYYPLPKDAIQQFASSCKQLLIVEDGQPVVEQDVRALLGRDYPIMGRLTGHLPRTGELTPDCVAASLGVSPRQVETPNLVVLRPPQLCPGCGHRDVFTALNQVAAEYPDARIFGDIGCYTLGALPPYESLASCVDMGASITMAKGAADAGLRPSIAVIGDSTFTHSGMTALLDAVNDRSPITVIISDNLTTAMTGGQDSAGTNKFEAICLGLGVEPEHIHVVVPLPKNMEEITRILRKEIAYEGVSVIIPRRECIQTAKRKKRTPSLLPLNGEGVHLSKAEEDASSQIHSILPLEGEQRGVMPFSKSIILSGVGGQGILSIATIIGEAAMKENLYIKQAEVHGMSQRGGDVQSNLRISSQPIASDLIPHGAADVIISMEPMEALRYLPYLSADGWVITSSAPFVNIPNYPPVEDIKAELAKLPHVIYLDIEQLAKDNGVPRSANIILLGAAQQALGIDYDKLEAAVCRVFARKGEAVVEANVKALAIGQQKIHS